MNTATNNSQPIKSVKSFKIIEKYFSTANPSTSSPKIFYAVRRSKHRPRVSRKYVRRQYTRRATPPSPIFKIDLHKRNKKRS